MHGRGICEMLYGPLHCGILTEILKILWTDAISKDLFEKKIHFSVKHIVKDPFGYLQYPKLVEI